MYEVWYLLLAHEEHEKNVGSIFSFRMHILACFVVAMLLPFWFLATLHGERDELRFFSVASGHDGPGVPLCQPPPLAGVWWRGCTWGASGCRAMPPLVRLPLI